CGDGTNPARQPGNGDEDMTVTGRRITQILTKEFAPTELQVVDESDRHKGHSGWRPEGETHFRVRIASAAFHGLSRVEIHRLINQALEGELKGGVHALAIEARPSEPQDGP